MISRRWFITLVLAAGLAGASLPGWGQTFPRKEVRFIVPYPPGGITDILARKLGEKLAATWGQTVLIDNRPGANGNLAAQMAARAEPDGHTIYMGFLGTHAANASLYADLGYDPVRDFTPISLIANAPMMLTVHRSRQRQPRSSSPTRAPTRASSTSARRAPPAPRIWRWNCSRAWPG